MVFNKKTLLICATLLVLIGIAAVGTYFVVNRSIHNVPEATKQIFSDTPTVTTYTDLDGKTLSLEEYLGQVIVVTSWASWSPFSKTDLETLNTLASNYTDKKVVFLAMNRKEALAQAQRYITTLPPLPHIRLVIDVEDRFYNLVGGYAMPETVVFDQKGEIVLHGRGVFDTVATKETLERLLSN